MEFELKITGSYLPDEPLQGKSLLRVEPYPSPYDHYLDIQPKGLSKEYLYLVEDLLDKDLKVMTEPTGENPYEFPDKYDYINFGEHKLGSHERIGLWYNDNYLITSYFDYDTYGADKPVKITFGVRWVLSRDLFNALMRRYNTRKEVEALEEEFQANFKPGDDQTEFFKKMHEIYESANDPD